MPISKNPPKTLIYIAFGGFISVDPAHRYASPGGQHFHLPHAEQIRVNSHPLIIIGVTVPATVPLPPYLPVIEREPVSYTHLTLPTIYSV